MYHKKPLKWVLRQFISVKLWSFGFLFGILYLVAGAFVQDWAHYSTILAASGVISGIMCASIMRYAIPKTDKSTDKPTDKSKLPAGWIYPLAGIIIGMFALMAAWGLFPYIVGQGGWITFILLVWTALTFLTRAAAALNFHIWAPTGIAVGAATNMMTWIGETRSFLGFTVTPNQMTVYFLTATLTIGAWLILTIVLMWITQTSKAINKILNSPPILFINTLLCLTWAAFLVMYPWLL